MATMRGTTGRDRLLGGTASDTISGLAGNDTLFGNGGNDNLNGGSGDDVLSGGSGNDRANGGTGNDRLSGDAGNDVLSGAFGNDRAIGGTGNDRLNGDAGNDVLSGGAGADVLSGGTGNDRLIGDAGDDTLSDGGGVDTISGGIGNDVIAVSTLTFDAISGGADNDTLKLSGKNLILDLTTMADSRLTGIERIDLSGAGNNKLILNAAEVANLSDTDILKIAGDRDDTVYISPDFKFVGGAVADGEVVRVFTTGAATIEVDLSTAVQYVMPSAFDLSTLDGGTGFRLDGASAGDLAGRTVASAGDVNGDGFGDLIVGASGADPGGSGSGAAYVLFGAAGGFASTIDLSALNGATGFRLDGAAAYDNAGFSTAAAGDVNGDGFGDLIVSAIGADPGGGNQSGAAFVVFGAAGGFASTIDLSALDGATGFRLDGAAVGDLAGGSVASAGDVNGDGFDDLIVGVIGADPGGTNSGAAYVLFGSGAGFASSIDLSTLDGSNGFRLAGAAAYDNAGRSVASAGDVNGDGFGDLIVGVSGADPGGSGSGAAYVVFGAASGFASTIALSALDGATGFRLAGAAAGDNTGGSVASAGDVNGDGFDDLIVGATGADPGSTNSGAAYVLFGSNAGFASSIDLSTLDGSNGFRLAGAAAYDNAGYSTAAAGDVNGDGFDDLIVGAIGADHGGAASGAVYVVFGAASGFASMIDLSTLDGATGFRLAGAAAGDNAGGSVASAGDVNGDGFDDLIVGAIGADHGGNYSGASHVIYGGDFRAEADVIGTLGADTIKGASTAEILVGAQGDDTVFGGGGADAINGGSGNDAIHVADGSFFRVDAGSGMDTLHFDYAGEIEFADLDANIATSDRGKIMGLEIIDTDNGLANAIILTKAELLDMDCDAIDVGGVASLDNVLKFDGDAKDALFLSYSDSWGPADTKTLSGYTVYKSGAVSIAVDNDILVFFA